MPLSPSATDRLDDSSGSADRLSGTTVGRLEPGEQFVLWALRRGAHEGGEPSAALLHGFRLAFGLAFMEEAFAAFTDLVAALRRPGRRDLRLFPLRCAFVGVDEQAVIDLIAGAQAGGGPWSEPATGRLVDPPAMAVLNKAALRFALILGRADLILPPWCARRAEPPHLVH